MRFLRARICVQDYVWEAVKLVIAAVSGGGIVRALGQNRNDAGQQALQLAEHVNKQNVFLAGQVTLLQTERTEQALKSGENRTRIEFLEERVHELTDLAQTNILQRTVVEQQVAFLTQRNIEADERYEALRIDHELLSRAHADLLRRHDECESVIQKLRSQMDGTVSS